MASIARTAYPRFRRLVTARELALMAPTVDDVAWAGAHARCGESSARTDGLADVFSASGVLPAAGDVPVEVVEHLRRWLGLAEGTLARCEARNVKAQRQLVRERCACVPRPRF
jgi:hypothetical protein